MLLPSLVIMSIIMVLNWIKNVRSFVTFEEITKEGLDNFFTKINNETYTGRGLEWRTAQLGHFWIELRVKNPNKQPKVNNHVRNKSNAGDVDFDRMGSEENRLVDYRDEFEQIQRISEKQSEVSVPPSSSRKPHEVLKDDKSDSKPPSRNNFLNDSISDASESRHNASENRVEPEAFQILEDEKELENYKASHSSRRPKQATEHNHTEINKTPIEEFEKPDQVPSQKNDGFGLEDLDLMN